MSRVKLNMETRVYICHKNMKSIGFFTVFRKFLRKILFKKYSTGNEEWIDFETATITSGYVLHNQLSISKAQLQTKRMHIPRKNEQYFYFSLTLKDTEIFPKLLF